MARVHSLDITLEVGEDLDVKGKSLQWAPPCGSVFHQGIVVQVLTQSNMEGKVEYSTVVEILRVLYLSYA